ncbi:MULTISPECIES: LysR family transcriptional regulator [unclassified Beijerinckia]|uniref:LysR family transcriptional regulator n=1 Tax=unclassified Beijerinckia TaxID=2638183 RepID=UPI0008987F3D|nr:MULTISPECIES: LysR family transcriptional regulator [unclassified Beijerinckia]MDH7796887.1 DNA-binding transcriptional LysR family regulator [Beijerinckia sp. GAS462]SEC63839.1 DNA-binding transcriptional regulator, LysR family [Beijerinckia sp. 28-YEA-48]
MDYLTSLRCFVAVAESGSFTTASEQLAMSRAMASKHVMDLEAHLGLRLLNRTTRSVSLTDAGGSYFERGKDILAALEEAEREVTSQAAEPVGRLRISAPLSFGITHVSPLVAAFAKANPRIAIDLTLNDRFVDLVDEGFDVAIRIGRLTDSSMIARRLAVTRSMICASPDYLARRGRPLVPADLLDHECLHYAYASGGNVWSFQGPQGEETRRVPGRIACNNGDALGRLAAAGAGIAIGPDFIMAPLVASGAVEEILHDYAQSELGIYIVHPSQRHMPLKLRAFIDFMVANMKLATM